MTTLFDKVSGNYDSFDSAGVTDSTASFKVDQFKGWYVTISSVEYLITGNTATKLLFSNSIAAVGSYEIAFLGRTKLNEIESDFSNTTKINDDIISKKYAQANIDISNRVVAYLRGLYNMNRDYYTVNGAYLNEFDPLANILNLDIVQQSFGYYVTYLIFKDLSIDQDSYNSFKSEDNFTLFKDTIKTNLALIQIDFDEDGKASNEEKRNSVSYMRLVR